MQFPVRDENTRSYCADAETGEDASIVLDPTLVYDFGDDEVMTRRIREFGRFSRLITKMRCFTRA